MTTADDHWNKINKFLDILASDESDAVSSDVEDSEDNSEDYSYDGSECDVTDTEDEDDGGYILGEEYRRFGYFRCRVCSKEWCSARAWCEYNGLNRYGNEIFKVRMCIVHTW